MAIKNVNVRIPDDLHALVKASAVADRRSLNSQVLALIEAGLTARGKGHSLTYPWLKPGVSQEFPR